MAVYYPKPGYKTFPEEIYVVSHHVHHVKSDEPGDPLQFACGNDVLHVIGCKPSEYFKKPE